MNIFSTFLLIISYTSVVYAQNLKIGQYCLNEVSGGLGICKSIGDCQPFHDIYSRSSIIFPCGYENGSLICCPDEPEETPTTPRISNPGKRISELKCSEYQSAVFYEGPTSFVPLISGGRSKATIQDGCGNKEQTLISGGVDAKPKEFPHMALLGVIAGNTEQLEWVCGGSLISDQFVLTAAHCFSENITVIRLGELDYDRTDEDASPENYMIMEIKLHPNYRHPMRHHDIALLKVDRKVEFNIYRRPACLSSSLAISQQKAFATGWGYTSDIREEKLSRLQKVLLNIFNQTECEESYPQESIIDSQLCAGSIKDNKDTCQGDSGGPLQVFHENEYCIFRILGVISFGSVCDCKVAAVYTRVYSYIDWIEENVWRNIH